MGMAVRRSNVESVSATAQRYGSLRPLAKQILDGLPATIRQDVKSFLHGVFIGKVPPLERYAEELYEAFVPLRERLRKKGQKVRLYRGQPVNAPKLSRKFLQWSSDPTIAAHFGASSNDEWRHVLGADVNIDDIIAVFFSRENDNYIEFLVRNDPRYQKQDRAFVPMRVVKTFGNEKQAQDFAKRSTYRPAKIKFTPDLGDDHPDSPDSDEWTVDAVLPGSEAVLENDQVWWSPQYMKDFRGWEKSDPQDALGKRIDDDRRWQDDERRRVQKERVDAIKMHREQLESAPVQGAFAVTAGIIPIDKTHLKAVAKQVAQAVLKGCEIAVGDHKKTAWKYRPLSTYSGYPGGPGMKFTAGFVALAKALKHGKGFVDVNYKIPVVVTAKNKLSFKSGHRKFVQQAAWRQATDEWGDSLPEDTQIVISLFGKLTCAELHDQEDQLEKEIYSVLIHEVTHGTELMLNPLKLADDVRETTGLGQKGYHNLPVELRAFIQQAVDEVLGVIDSGLSFSQALKKSGTWLRVKDHLTPKNKKRMLREIGNAVAQHGVRVSSAFKVPHDAWKHIKHGNLDQPDEFVEHPKMWKRIAKRLGIDPERGVRQRAPVIGGRRRYHHRPLTTWELPKQAGSITLTPDKMEGKAWNRMKSKRHPAMPVVHDVFEVRLRGKKPMWAIHHDTLRWPPEQDWLLFVDTFFRWRAMQYGGLRPADPEDVQEFLEYVAAVDEPSVYDPSEVRRRRPDQAIPFAKKERGDHLMKARQSVWRDPGLERKVRWAKSILSFLKQNNVKHRDLDPSNLGKTRRGKTVVTNIAESRSKGRNTGRTGRISGSGAPSRPIPINDHDNHFGPSKVAPLLRTAQAYSFLIEGPDAPLLESSAFLSGGTRRTVGLIHLCPYKRAALLEAAFGIGFPEETVRKGLKKLEELANYHGEKAWHVYEVCKKRLAGFEFTRAVEGAVDLEPVIASLTRSEIARAINQMLDKPNTVQAGVRQRHVLARIVFRDRDLRTALLLASNDVPATVVPGWLAVRALRGMAKFGYLADKSGGQTAQISPLVCEVLDSRTERSA